MVIFMANSNFGSIKLSNNSLKKWAPRVVWLARDVPRPWRL